MERFDVAVVGARCAGAPLALELARHGLRVCVLDRARFPSDTASTHVIQPRGVAVLDRLGLRADVESAGAVPVERFTLVTDDARIDPDPADPRLAAILATDRPPGLCARRLVLDQVLVAAAAGAGADVRPAVGVTDLLRDDTGRVIGVRTDTGDVAASLVIGADGRNSTVARLAGARSYHTYRAGRVPAWGYFDGVADPERRLRIGVRAGLAFIACPTDAGLYLAGVAPAAADQAWFLADRERNFAALLQRWPELADLLAGARRVGPIRAMPDLAGYFRESSGPGWVLTGDAGHFKDPTPAQGIADAFVQAERLAGVIAGHDLSDPRRPRRRVARLVALARSRLLRHALVRPRHGPRRATPPADRGVPARRRGRPRRRRAAAPGPQPRDHPERLDDRRAHHAGRGPGDPPPAAPHPGDAAGDRPGGPRRGGAGGQLP